MKSHRETSAMQFQKPQLDVSHEAYVKVDISENLGTNINRDVENFNNEFDKDVENAGTEICEGKQKREKLPGAMKKDKGDNGDVSVLSDNAIFGQGNVVGDTAVLEEGGSDAHDTDVVNDDVVNDDVVNNGDAVEGLSTEVCSL